MSYQARYLYSELSSLITARKNCAVKRHEFTTDKIKSHCAVCGQIYEHANHAMVNPEWFDKHTEKIEQLVKQHMPHGSGFDSGTKIDFDASHGEKLVFNTGFHHMNDGGYYDGWTEHTITVTPSLSSHYHLRISGRNRNEIKDHVHESFDFALSTDVTYDLYVERYPEFKLRHVWENEDGTPSQCYQAWYVGDQRFWNRPGEARQYAAEQMQNKLYGRAA